MDKVENELKSINVPDVTISKVKGYGQHMNFYTSDWLETHAHIEISSSVEDKNKICKAFKKGVGSPELSNGFIAVLPVTEMFSVSDFNQLL